MGPDTQVFHEFVVTQGERSIEALHELEEYFGVGQVIVNRRQRSSRPSVPIRGATARGSARNGDPVLSAASAADGEASCFAKFAACVELVAGDSHRSRQGLLEIVRIVETMNRRKPRPELVRILRDHTPDIRDSG